MVYLRCKIGEIKMGRQRKTLRNKRKIKIDHTRDRYIDKEEISQRFSKAITRQTKVTIVSIFFVTIVMISSAYAVFSSVQKSEDYNTLSVGVLKVDFDKNESNLSNVINLNGAYPVTDQEGQNTNPYRFSITNSGTLDANYKIRIIDDNDMIEEDGCSDNLLNKGYVKVSINNGEPFILTQVELNDYTIREGVLAPGQKEEVDIRIWINQSAGNDALGKHYHSKIVVESESKSANKYIKAAYQYSESCATGEEPSCVSSTCYQSNNIGSCSPGTIIKYAVNNQEEKYFYVLHDDGSRITMQQRENIVYNTAWYSVSTENNHGPAIILSALESVTAGWTNVKNQTYTMGTTNFNNTNGYTGCNRSGCDTNSYTLEKREAKARMITFQEGISLGCNVGVVLTCPKWLYNYLNGSTSYGGTVNDATGEANFGYWTMSADNSVDSPNDKAWYLANNGSISTVSVDNNQVGARAVVVINK